MTPGDREREAWEVTITEIVKAWFAATESLSYWDDVDALDDLVARLDAAWQREAEYILRGDQR